MNIKSSFTKLLNWFKVNTLKEVAPTRNLRMGDKSYPIDFSDSKFMVEGKSIISKAGGNFIYTFSYNEHIGEKENRVCKVFYEVYCIKTKQRFVIDKETFDYLFVLIK